MTAFAALSLLDVGDRIPITSAAIQTEGFDTLTEGEVWQVGDLVDYMMLTSSNRAARALRDAGDAALRSRAPAPTTSVPTTPTTPFIAYMNATAQRLGLAHTTFTNETGLDIRDTYATNFGSAHDVARLFMASLTQMPRVFSATESDSLALASRSALHEAVTTNKALADIPGLIASKTGFTDVAGGNLAIAFEVEQGRPIVIVVLASGKDERFTDVLTLVEAVRTAYGVTTVRAAPLPL
jgi:D-alanyl-D-alanine carboxypeptidase